MQINKQTDKTSQELLIQSIKPEANRPVLEHPEHQDEMIFLE